MPKDILKGYNEEDLNKKSSSSDLLSNYKEDPTPQVPTYLEYREPSQYEEGYLPFASGNIEEYKAQKQSNIDRWANAVPRLISKTATEALKTPGYIVAGIEALTTDKTLPETLNNAWLNGLENLDQKTKENFAVYTPKAVKEGNLWDNITSTSFWTSEGVDGVGFLLGNMGPSFALKGVGLAGKLAKVGVGAKLAENLELGTATVFNATTESLGEAKGLVDALKQEFDKKLSDQEINPSTNKPWTKEETEEAISTAAQNSFLTNFAILLGPDFIMNKNLLGRFTPDSQTLNKIADPITGALKEISPKASKELRNEYLKGVLKSSASEGLWEEGVQNAVENTNRTLALNESNKGYFTELANQYAETLTTTEGQKAIFLGSFLGSVGGLIGTRSQVKGEEQYLNKVSKILTNNFEGFSTQLTDIYQENEDGSLKLDSKSLPITNKAKLADITANIAKEQLSSNLQDAAVQAKDIDAFEYFQNQSFTRFTKPYLTIEGGDELLNKHIDLLSNKLNQFNQTLGNKDVTESQIKNDFKIKVKKLQKIYPSIENSLNTDLLNFNEEDQFQTVQANDFVEKLKSAALQEYSKQLFLTDKIQELNKDLTELSIGLSSSLPQNKVEAEKIKTKIESYNKTLEESIKDYENLFNKKEVNSSFKEQLAKQQIFKEQEEAIEKPVETAEEVEETPIVENYQDIVTDNVFNRPYNIKERPLITPQETEQLLSGPVSDITVKLRPNSFTKGQISEPRDRDSKIITSDVKIKAPDFETIININGKDIGYTPYSNKFVTKDGKPVNIQNLTEKQFRKHITKDPNIDFQTFKAEHKALQEFDQALQAYWTNNKTSNSKFLEVPKEAYKIVPIGQLDFAEFDKRPDLEGNPLFDNNGKGPIIFNTWNGTFLTKNITDSRPNQYEDSESTFALATLPNGIEQWIKLHPKTLKPVEQDKLLKEIQDVLNQVKTLKSGTSLDELKALSKSINTFIATTKPTKEDRYVRFNVSLDEKENKYRLQVAIIDYTRDQKQKIKEFINIDKLDSIDELVDLINTNKFDIKVTKNSFKQNIPLDLPKSDKNTRFFTTATKTNVLKNFNIKFQFNPSILTEKIEVQESLNEPKKDRTLSAKDKALAKQKELNDKLNKVEKGESLNNPFAGYIGEEDPNGPTEVFKISESKATEIIDIKQAEEWIKQVLPDFIEVKDIKTVLNQLSTNGIVWGTFQNNIIYLSRNAQKGTEFHEAFHAVFRLLLKDSDIQLYLNRAKKEMNLSKAQLASKIQALRNNILSYNNLSDKKLEELVYEEYMADRFADWQKSKNIKTNNIFKVLFAKIKRFIDWLINANPNIENLFYNIDKGAFRDSEIQSNQFKTFGSKDLFKLLPGKNSIESDNIIRTIGAKLISANDSGEKVSIAKIIQEYIDLYDPDSDANKAKIKDLPQSVQDQFTEDLTNEWAFYSDPEKQKLITEQVSKLLESYNFDPETAEVQEQEETEEGERNFEMSFNEKDPTDKQIKKFVTLLLYDTTDKFGNKIKEAVDGPLLYNTIQRVAVGTPKDKIIPRIKALAKYNNQTNALLTALLEKTGYDEKNYPNGVGLVGEQFLTKFYKAFELEKVNYLQIVLNNSKDDKFQLYSANINKRVTFNRWNNNFTSTVFPKLLNNKIDFKKDIITDITQVIELLQGSRTKVSINKKNYLDKVNATRALLDNLGLDFSPTYLEFSLGNDQDLKEEFSEVRPFTVDDLVVLKKLVQENINLFSENGMAGKLTDISDADATFREDQFEKIFTDANGKSRYSFVRPNHILSKNREIKEKYSVNSRIEQDIKNNSYNSYNYLLNNKDNNTIKQTFKNLDIALTGDIREEEGNTATFKTIDPASFLVNIHALFSKQSKSIKEGEQNNAYFVPSIFEAKRSSFAVKLPIDNTLFKDGKITEDALEKIYNTVFLQEYNRIKGNFGDNFKVKKWINLEFLNNNQSLSKKILESKDVSTLKPEILEAINQGFSSEIKEHESLIKRMNIENSLNTKFINDNYGNLTNYTGNFYLNDFLNTIAYNQLIQGDLALTKNSVDRVKRNSGELAAGISRGKTIFKVAYITETKVKGDPDITDSLINSDDAQVFSTIKEKKQRLKDFGRLTPKLESILDRLDNPEIKKGKSIWPTSKEIKDAGLDLISEKTVTYGEDLEGNAVYHKMSDFTLTKKLTSYYSNGEWLALPGKEVLHNKRIYMETHGIDQLIPESASKMFTGEKLDHNSFKDQIPTKEPRIYEISGENQRLQVENHSSNSDITYGTQLLQLIDTELPNTPENQELRKQYYDTLAQIRTESMKFALSMLIKENGDKANISKFLRNIRESIDENTPDTNTIEFFSETNGDFKYDPNLPHIKAKFEQLFLSHFKDGVLRAKIAGVKATLVTSAGYEILYNTNTGEVVDNETFDKSEDKKVYKDEEKYKTRELKIHKLVGDKIEFAEVAMTRKQAELYNLSIGEINTIDPKILTMFGHRIPTQSHHSMIPFKIVEFLPEYYGSVIIVPKEVVYLAGSDFDVDSLFVYRHSFYKQDGKLKVFGTANTDEDKFTEYKLSWLKNKDIKREIKTLENNSDKYQLLTANETSDTLNQIDEDYLKAFILISDQKLAQEIKNLKEEFLSQTLKQFGLASTQLEFNSLPNKANIQALNNKLVDINIQILTNPELAESLKTPTSVQPLQDDATFINQFTGKEEGKFLHNGINGKIDSFTNNKVGSQTVGNAANTTIASASLTKHKVDLNQQFEIKIDDKVYNTFATDLEDDVTFLKNRVSEVKEGIRRKNETLSTMVSAITDNAKERLSSKLNLQSYNLSQIGVLQALGIGRSRTMLIANQPVIVEFNELMERSKAAIGSSKESKKKIFKQLVNKYKGEKVDLTSKQLLESIKTPNNDVQSTVLDLFIKADKISDDIMKLNNLLKINKGLGTSIEELDQIQEALINPPTTFDINKIIENDSNVKSNIENYKNIIRASEKFIIKQTPGFKTLYEKVSNNLNQFLTNDQKNKVKNDLQTFLSLKALNINFSRFNNLLYIKEQDKTLGENFRTLLNIEEFNTNPLVQYMTTEEKDGLDLVKTDSRSKLSPKTIELFTDSYKQLQMSNNPDIKKFANDMFIYLIVKDNLQFKNDSFIKFIAPQQFLKFSQALRQLNIELQNPDTETKYYREFIEVFARNTANRDLIRTQYKEPVLVGEKAVKNPPTFFYKEDFNTGFRALYKLSKESKYELVKTYTNYNGYLHQNYEENLKVSQKPKGFKQVAVLEPRLEQKPVSEKIIIPILEDLSKRFNLEYKTVNDPSLDWRGRFINNQVVINLASVNLDTPFHEFAHPFIRIIRKTNRPLYNSLVREMQSNPDGIKALKYTEENYKQLDPNDRIEEAIVQLIGMYSSKNINPETGEKLIDRIKQLLKKIVEFLGIKVNPSTLPNMTLKELGALIASDTKIDVSRAKDFISQEEVSEQKNEEPIKEDSPYEKQIKYIEKRINSLTKKQKEFKEGSKQFEKLQEEIDLINQEYEQFQETSEGNFLHNLGTSTLDRVEDYINSFEEGQNIDFEKIEHSVEVLEVWGDFKGLIDRSRELIDRLFPYENTLRLDEINKARTEKEEITQQEIDKQDKDISRLTKWTGTLSDVPNYIVRTIGSIIKAAQNKISTTNKQLTDKIQSEVDLLVTWAKKNNIPVKDMYNQIIEERNGTLKLKLEAPKDPDLLKFYNFYQSTLLEAEDKIPQQIGKYYIPNIKTKSFKGALAKLSPFGEVKLERKSNREELFADIVPSYLTENLSPDQKSRDLGAALLTFAGYANNYEEMSKILPKVRVLQRGLTKELDSKGQVKVKTFKKSSQPGVAVDGEKSNLYSMVDEYIEMQVKGKMKKVEGRIRTGPLFDENGKEIGEKFVDFGKLGDELLKYNSLLRIGLSPITALSNILFGDISNFIEGVGGQFYNLKDLKNASNIFFKQTYNEDVKSTLNKLLETVNPLQELEDYQSIDQVSLKSKMSEEKLLEYMYAPQKMGEKWLQSRTMLAIMLHENLITKEGKLTEEGEKLLKSEEEINKLRDKVQRLNGMIHGRYSQREAATMNQFILFRLVSQFRKWIPAVIETRLGKKQYDSRLGVEIEGRYNTLARFIFSKEIMTNFAKMAKGELEPLEMYNMKKNLTELTLLGASALAFLALGAGSDEERKRRLRNPYIKTGLTLLNRVAGDIEFFYSPTKINELGKNAIPLSKTMGDLAQAFKYIPYAFYIGDSQYKTGSRKNENKFYNTSLRLIPGVKLIPDLKRLFNNKILEEQR